MPNPFWNARERRLRAGWRIAIQFAVFVAILTFLTLLPKGNAAAAVAGWIGSVAAVVGATALLARRIDHRQFADFGFHLRRRWWADLGFGLVLGALMLTGIFWTERAAGWVVVAGGAGTSFPAPLAVALLVKLAEWVATGVNEELVFRGYQLRNLAEGFEGGAARRGEALRLAAIASSIFFGVAHLANGQGGVLSTLNIVLAGLLLSLPLLLSGELATSVGLHISWNLFEGTVFGFPVSGVPSTTRLITTRQTGPELWTGGDFGPEAGLVCLFWMLLAGAAILVRWRMRRPRPAPPHSVEEAAV
jgi:membrane protease YdiL (CAAX protease family)